MDPRPSRRDKMSSIPPDHLLLVARAWPFGGSNSVAFVTKVLESAAERGNEESAWLLDKIRSKGAIPEFGGDWRTKETWLAQITYPVVTEEDSLRAQYYRGKALVYEDRAVGLDLLRQSAVAGFAPAMSVFGEWIISVDREEGLAWLRRAAELNDPDALYQLSCREEEKSRRWHLLQLSADGGSVRGLWFCAHDDRSSLVESATLGARFTLLTRGGSILAFRFDVQTLIQGGSDVESLQVRFVVGRELDGYDQFWGHSVQPDAHLLACVDLYRSTLHAARRAALQTVVGLREIGLTRDVAVLIGQAVFGTRLDVPAWWIQASPLIS